MSRLRRLDGMIADPGSAEIAFEVMFGLDDQREVRVDVHVSGRVPLRCQRSLRLFWHAIDSRSTVGIVPDDRAADRLPEDYEPLLCPDRKVELVRLIGEEVLLGLPLVPIDPDSSRVGGDERPPDTHRPFAELAEMRKRRDTDNDQGD
ncbi:MAG: hypothetical protein GVY32_08935 [Gammaproteobacteria bacterium]|nr:hypothetical protein [Gammaproteobacteria bacterium]